jgi:uracil phosphoribosyltransferase
MASARRTNGVQSPALGVGPSYRPAEEKPTATVSREVPFDNVHVLGQTPQLIALLTYVGHLAL